MLAAYLPVHNAKFARPAKETTRSYRPVPTRLNLDVIFSFQYDRTVGHDNTVRLGKDIVQIEPNAQRSSYAKAKTRFCVGLDGSIRVYYQGRCIANKPCTDPNIVLRHRNSVADERHRTITLTESLNNYHDIFAEQ
jgi:hypothetical protein